MFATGGLRIDQAPPLNLPFRFFATAPLFLILTALSLFAHGPNLLDSPLLPETIATVHLTVLGWIVMIMFGAMYQMIPVLAGIPVPWPRLVPWVHGLLIVGVVTLYLGLATHLHPWMLLFASGGLGGAILLFVVPVGYALIQAPAKHPTVTFMRVSLLSLVGVLILGGVFLGEYAHGFLNLDRIALLTIHVIWGLLGWVGLLIVGVSFQVLPMFYMTRDIAINRARAILLLWCLFLLGQPVTVYFYSANQLLFWLPTVPFLTALLLYGYNLFDMLKNRKRRFKDATYAFWLLGLASGLVALPLMASWGFIHGDWNRFMFGGLMLFGFASSIILGMLYKIIPFLVWFHRFSRLAGLVEIPMMDDLVPGIALRLQFPVHLVVVLTIVTVILTGWAPLLTLLAIALIVDAALVLYTLGFALGHKPPPQEEVPDFASFFQEK